MIDLRQCAAGAASAYWRCQDPGGRHSDCGGRSGPLADVTGQAGSQSGRSIADRPVSQGRAIGLEREGYVTAHRPQIAVCRSQKNELPRDSQPYCDTAIGVKLRLLGKRDSYPEHPRRVEVIETHFSWVFLTDTHAYKLKKAVQGIGFDFRTVEARRRNALAELRLNRRLSPDVYLGIVPLNRCIGGDLALGGIGEPIDWLLKMVRLDADRMLDSRLARGDLSHAELEGLANRLAAFFATARPVHLSAPQFCARLKAEIKASRSAFRLAGDPKLLAVLQLVLRRLGSFSIRCAALFRRRIADRRMVDGHGDLRPEHVYLKGSARIIDCLEFRADLRQLDPVNELAYFALECRRLGGPALGPRLLRRYRQHTGDRPPGALVRFYAARTALARSRIAIEHVAEPGARTPRHWIDRAAAYLAIAAKESQFLSR
jgi:uncharacterized protein